MLTAADMARSILFLALCSAACGSDGVKCGGSLVCDSGQICCLSGPGSGTCRTGACNSNETPYAYDGPEDCSGSLCCMAHRCSGTYCPTFGSTEFFPGHLPSVLSNV